MQIDSRDRKTLLVRNGFLSVASWATPLSLGFIVTPIVVRRLGDDDYGLYSLIVGFMSYSFTFGIGKAAAKYVAESKATGDVDRVSGSVSVLIVLSVSVGVASMLIIAVFAPAIVDKVLSIKEPMRDTAITALYFAGVCIFGTVLSQVFQFILQGLQRFDLFLLYTNASGFCLNLGNALLVLEGYGVLGLIIWNTCVIIITTMFFWRSASRNMPELRFRVALAHSHWKPVTWYAASIIVYQVCGNALLLFERGFIVRKFGTEALTYYVVPMVVGFYFQSLVSSLGIVVFPTANEIKGSEEKLLKLYRSSTKIILTLTVFFVLSCFVAGGVFLNVWVRNGFSEQAYSVLVVHALTFAVICVTIVAWQMTETFGYSRLNSYSTVIMLAIAIPLMIFLASPWQIEGVAVARLVGVSALLPLIIFVERRLIISDKSFWPALLTRIAIAGSISAACEYFILRLFESGWVGLVACGGLGGIVYAGTLLMIGHLDKEERSTLINAITRSRRVQNPV